MIAQAATSFLLIEGEPEPVMGSRCIEGTVTLDDLDRIVAVLTSARDCAVELGIFER